MTKNYKAHDKEVASVCALLAIQAGESYLVINKALRSMVDDIKDIKIIYSVRRYYTIGIASYIPYVFLYHDLKKDSICAVTVVEKT